MVTWLRTSPLDHRNKTSFTETWICRENGVPPAAFDVKIRVSKALDIVALKGTSLQDVREYAKFLRQTAQRLYADPQRLKKVLVCPCCASDTLDAAPIVTAFGVSYLQCAVCGHVFVGDQLTPEALNELFIESDSHAAVYTDRSSIEIRLDQIVKPKLEWLLDIYQQHYGRPAARLVDVGAGGGHFVEVCQQAGLTAQGYEINSAARQFAAQVFGINLSPQDYLRADHRAGAVEVVTFWGLLEYIQQPQHFLAAARQQLTPENGMLIVEVPRFECLSSAIQQQFPERITRHLDPTSHMNCFSDNSLATILQRSGFRPIAAWYFGMDAYELLLQLALHINNEQAFMQFAHLIPHLQHYLDAALLCDDIIIAAVPI